MDIIYLFSAIGMVVTTILILSSMYLYIYIPFKKYLRRKRKIRFLCKHDYVKKFYFAWNDKSELEIECRNCGKKKTIYFTEDK